MVLPHMINKLGDMYGIVGRGETVNCVIPFDPGIPRLQIYPRGRGTEKHTEIYMERYSLSYNSKNCTYKHTLNNWTVSGLPI